MPPFELPNFYLPWPARLNPNLETARIHSKAWAYKMGILGPDATDEHNHKIWDERDFDKHDYALLCSYIHPETPGPELNLMTEWNIWAFYVDDYFLRVYQHAKDRVGSKKYLDRVPLFMPVDLVLLSEPTNPMERALADLWMRTAPEKSKAWRSRIIEDTRRLFEAFMWELKSISEQRVANPIEYIEMRRRAGAALWAADLVEHALFVEIPERIAITRSVQVLRSTFADAVHLRNDIFSYECEILRDGELTNAVLVFERFLGVDTQRAVNLVNDLLTSRLQQFEHTIFTELLPLFDEYGLDALERTNMLVYIRGLQDWQSGGHEWHVRTRRYLNPSLVGQRSNANDILIPGLPGFGMAAMRITPDTQRLSLNRFKNYNHIPYQKVGPTRLPKFYMPFTATVNPHLDTARRHSKSWARQMGMFDSLPGRPDIFLWDEDRFDTAEFALFTSLVYPTVTGVQLDILTYWFAWATYAEDYLMDVYGRTSNIGGAKLFCARLWAFMPVESASSASVPFLPVERGLLDVWTCSTEKLPTDQRGLFRKAIADMLESWLWELANQIQHRIPDPVDYLEMRRKTFGSDLFFHICLALEDQTIKSEVHDARIVQALNNAAVDCACLTNDIFSYQKEIEFEGDIHNGVLVIQNFLGCDQTEAVEIANKLITARIKQFEHITATELSLLCEDFDLDVDMREALLKHVAALQNLMAGSLEWHVMVKRYDETSLRNAGWPKLLDNPSGLGTAAARILEMTGSRMLTTLYSEHAKQAPQDSKAFAVSHLALPFPRKKDEAQASN